MKAIVHRRQKRRLLEPSKQDLVFKLRDEAVPQEKIDRWMDRNYVPQDSLYSPQSGARKHATILIR